jgi:hypothetical protein
MNDFPIITIDAVPDKTIDLDATGSKDPDNHDLLYKWLIYKEIGTYGKSVEIKGATSQKASITIPSDAIDKTIHVILEVADDG